MIRTKRVYDPPAPEDGYRLLVRRLAREGTVTLPCSCQDETCCHRTLLKEILERAAG
jgi:uncharacterized protein YeaO (DUF488 family)